MTVDKLRTAVRKAGGTLERDGVGGLEMIAPLGYRWVALEVSCQPLPLSECYDREERQDLLCEAYQWALDGVELIPTSEGRYHG